MKTLIQVQILLVIIIGRQATKQYTSNGQALVTKLGMVAVYSSAWKETLFKLNQLNDKCRNRSRFIPVLTNVSAPEDYGLNDRYNRISEEFKSGGAACLGGNDGACKLIQKGSLEWVKNPFEINLEELTEDFGTINQQ